MVAGDQLAGLAVWPPAHRPLSHGQVLDGPVHHLQLLDGPRGAVVGLQVLHRLLAQGDDVHVLRLLLGHVTLQHTESLHRGAPVRRGAPSDQRRILVRRLGQEGESGVGGVRGDDADLLVLNRHKVHVVHVARHHQLDLLPAAGGQLVRLQDAARLLLLRGVARPFLVVRFGVRLQVVEAREREAAEGAGEGLPPRVRGDVSASGARVREGFVADGAVVRFLPSGRNNRYCLQH